VKKGDLIRHPMRFLHLGERRNSYLQSRTPMMVCKTANMSQKQEIGEGVTLGVGRDDSDLRDLHTTGLVRNRDGG